MNIENHNKKKTGGQMCNQLTVLLGVLLLRFLVQGSSLVAVLPVLPTI